VFHADGKLAEAPIALCEVQAYVYEAKLMASRLAEVAGEHEAATELDAAAGKLREKFERDFWCAELRTYAIALDGEKRPCRVRSSNAGHCLFAGIASAEHAAGVAEGLASDAFDSGWGLRTIPVGEPRYNPMSYHNGSIWPHDNAVIASGLARYGFKDAVARIFGELFDASLHTDLHRLPELYCGFDRRPGEGPTLYPVACNPQAWAAATPFSLIESCLGLRIDAVNGSIHFNRPCLPEVLHGVTIRNLKLPAGSVDFIAQRHDGEVAIAILQRTGNVRVIVEQ
jgi:glycogen debranching enzyme